MRFLLSNEWASVRKWYRYQPLDYIKEYFGVKIGLYFAWLGYYTYMLLLASTVGCLCFLYSWFSLDNYIPVYVNFRHFTALTTIQIYIISERIFALQRLI